MPEIPTPRQDRVAMLRRAARLAETGACEQLSHHEAYYIYSVCAELLLPIELAQLAERYYARVVSQERAALARLFHQSYRQVADPAVRRLIRLDPHQASAAQLGQLHYLAHKHYPQVIDSLFRPGEAQSAPVVHRAVAAIAAEAALAVLEH